MPSTIRLTIDLDARLKGIDQTIEGLKKTQAAGKSFNQALKTTSIDQMKLALERAYQANSIYNGEVKASTMYLRDQKKAMDAIALSLGKGPMTYTDSSGITQQVTTMKEAYTQFADLTQFVNDNASFAKSAQGVSAFSLSGFYSDMEKDSKIAGLFGTELDQVDTKLASLRTKISEQYRIQLDMKDLDAIDAKLTSLEAKRASVQTYLDKANMPGSYGGDATEQAKQQALYNAQLSKTNTQIAGLKKEREVYVQNASSIKDMQQEYTKLSATREDMTKYKEGEFFTNLDKQSRGVRMFGTELDDVRMRMQAIKSQGMDLSMKGGDPNEIRKLSQEYKQLETRSKELSKATSGTGTRIKNLIKNFVSAQLIVYGIRTAMSFLTNGFRDSTAAADAAIETANLFNTTFEQVATSANTAGATLSNQFGLAMTTAQNAIGTFGDLAIGFGQTSGEALKFADSAARTQMDLISFKNITGDLAEQQKNFASGLAGNNKNFRQYGVIVKETDVAHRLAMKGLDKLTGSELELAKMQERLNIVIEQSPNAIGDMMKTFDSAQNVQRRYGESMKELKENIGEWALPALTTMRLFILSHVDAYNSAKRARDNYEKGTGYTLIDTTTEPGIMKGIDAVEKFMKQEREKGLTLVGKAVASVGYGINPYKYTLGEVEKSARAFGVTGKWILDNVLTEHTDEFEEQVLLLDKEIEKERLLKKATEERNNATAKYASTLSSLIDKISESGNVFAPTKIDETAQTYEVTNQTTESMDAMIKDFIGKAPDEFVAGIEGALGNIDLSKALGDKNKAASALYDVLNNAIIRSNINMNKYLEDAANATDQIDKDAYANLALNEKTLIGWLTYELEKVVKNYATNMSQINFDTQTKAIDQQIAQLEKKNSLEQEYIFKGDSVVSSIMAQYNAEQALTTLLNEKKITQEAYNDLLAKSNKYYAQDVERAKALYDISKSMSDMEAISNPFGDDQRMVEYISYLKTVNESNIGLAASFGLLKDGIIKGKGNIDLTNRPIVNNADGSKSTIKSFSTEIDGVEVLLPSIINGMEVSAEKAIQHYFATGEYLAKFDIIQKQGESWEEATLRTQQEAKAYAQALHNYEAAKLALNMDAERDYINAIKKIQKEVIDSIKDLSKSISDENKILMQDLATPFGESAVDTAKRTRRQTQADIPVQLQKEMESFLSPSEKKAIKDSMGYLNAQMMLSADEMAEVTKYRKNLEVKAELEYQQALKEAHDASLSNIQSMWEGLGDVGMVKGWKDTFETSFAYSMENISADKVWKRVARTGQTFDDAKSSLATKDATKDVVTAVILEFANHVEAVDEIMGIVTTAFEELGPIVNDFLQPFIPIIKILVESLNIFVPILTLLFPLMKALAVSVIMLNEPFQMLAKVIQYAIGKITFWTKSDDIAWSEVQDIHATNMQTISDIWAMEISARASYVSELTDAQKGEIDAYKEMYDRGILNLGEYLGLRNAVTGGTDTSTIEKFAKGGDFITNGPKVIMVGEAGREHVKIEPISSSNDYQSLRSGVTMVGGTKIYSPTFNITTNNPKEVTRMVEDTMKKMDRKGESYAS